MTANTARLSVYALMDDKALGLAIADLQTKVDQMQYARGPVAGRMRDAYTDALDAARAEAERRRT